MIMENVTEMWTEVRDLAANSHDCLHLPMHGVVPSPYTMAPNHMSQGARDNQLDP